jgi:hypothetical protein
MELLQQRGVERDEVVQLDLRPPHSPARGATPPHGSGKATKKSYGTGIQL